MSENFINVHMGYYNQNGDKIEFQYSTDRGFFIVIDDVEHELGTLDDVSDCALILHQFRDSVRLLESGARS